MSARQHTPETPRRRWREAFRRVQPYLFVSPFFVLFAVFGLFPMLFSIGLSLHRWDPAAGLSQMQWVGLDNFRYALLDDDWFSQSMRNTLWIALVSGLPQHLVALPLAWWLHTRLRGLRNLVLGLYFLPFITSTVALSLVFTSMFSKDFGIVNSALGHVLGLAPIDWNQPEYTKIMISLVVFWRYVGWNTVLYLSALQTVPRDLLEAAALDGARRGSNSSMWCCPCSSRWPTSRSRSPSSATCSCSRSPSS